MLIAILNQSTVVANADVATMTAAIASQVQVDAAPIWDRAPAAVVFYTDPTAVPAAARGIAIVDTIQDQPTGVLDPPGRLHDVRVQGQGAAAVGNCVPQLAQGDEDRAVGPHPAAGNSGLVPHVTAASTAGPRRAAHI
jgi:hypothetical protein